MSEDEIKGSKEKPPEPLETNLEFVTDDELWNELSKRYRNCTFLYERDGKDQNSAEYGVFYHGSLPAMLGLCTYGRIKFLKGIHCLGDWYDDEAQ